MFVDTKSFSPSPPSLSLPFPLSFSLSPLFLSLALSAFYLLPLIASPNTNLVVPYRFYIKSLAVVILIRVKEEDKDSKDRDALYEGSV